MIQPPRGFGENPVAIYHDPFLAPSHHYLVAYRWLKHGFGAHAVVHLGKHGSMEWLPGKNAALCAQCAIDAAITDLPLVYPFLVNDPGEGAQAKRRAHAVVIAWRAAIGGVEGDVGVLVWGDPAFCDSTLRVASQLGRELTVIPGVSSISLLAARFAMALHEVGRPVHITTARRLFEAVDRGEDNIVAMLLWPSVDLSALRAWTIWWGANLGTDSQRLVHGRIGDVAAEIAQERAAAGWVMDLCLLRK